MAQEPKTRPTNASVEAFIAALARAEQRDDSRALVRLMQGITGQPPVLWGPSIIGFGSMPLRYASGRELDWPVIAFSPRKANFSIYFTCDIQQHAAELAKLGPHKTGVGCLYIKRLADVDVRVLKGLLQHAAKG